MKRLMRILPAISLALLLAAMVVAPALAQDGGERGERRGGDRRQRMDWENMSEEQQAQMRERFEQRRQEVRQEQGQRMREALELSEEEYAAIEPMIEQVQRLARESIGAGRSFPGGRSRGGPGGGWGPNPFADEDSMSPQGKSLTEATEALRESLDNKDTPSDEVKDRLASLRKARVALQDALRQAREELRSVVTPRQEAALVLRGTLD